MDKRVVLAKKVDHIDIEVRPMWALEQCQKVAQRIANDHNIQVRFTLEGQDHAVDPEAAIPIRFNHAPRQMSLPEFAPIPEISP